MTELGEQVSLADMDAAVAEIKEKEAKYNEAKQKSDALYEEYQEAKAKVLELMEKADKTTYIAEGVARVTLKHKMSVQVPKTLEDKRKFFTWLRANKGDEIADSYMSVNSNSLNTLFNELEEEWARKGEVLMIDGLGEPVARKTLSVIKA